MSSVSSTTSTSSVVDQLIYIDSEPIRTTQSKIKALESKKSLLNSINTQVSSLQKQPKIFIKLYLNHLRLLLLLKKVLQV